MTTHDDSARGVYQTDAFGGLSTLPENHGHAAVVDYPWRFEIQTSAGKSEPRRLAGQGDGVADREIDHADAMFSMEADDRFNELVSLLEDVLVKGAWLICLADDRFQEVVRDAIRDSAFTLRRNWAWTPESMGMGTYGRVDHYPIPVATLGDTDRYVTDRPTLFRVPGGRQTDYPTGKPVSLYRQILRPPVIENDERLIEPFCGSGPGAAVASERGLKYWGADKNPDAVEQARTRLHSPRLTDLADF